MRSFSGNDMDDELRSQIYNNLNRRETEVLLDIWKKHKLDEWQAEAFEIIKAILLERLGDVPPQSDSLMELAPTLARAHNHRGLNYEEVGQWDRALAEYREAVRLDPGWDVAWENLKGTEWVLEDAYDGEVGQAIEQCDLARQKLPAIAVAHNYLGLIFEASGQIDSAVNAYLAAISSDACFYPARENLANARIKLEQQRYREMDLQNGEGTQGPKVGDAAILEFGDLRGPWKDHPIPGWIYLDEKACILTGWPGHRTRPGRTG